MKKIIVGLILVCGAYLAFKGLGAAAFWDDEADVGIISRNYLATGKLIGWDGRNLYAQNNGTVLDQNLLIINPPLMYWLCASSFKIFGAGTWAGRFPFAMCGVLTLAVFALLLREEFAPDGWLWLYALGGLAFSPAFLLYSRQCRYYAPCMLFAVLFYYGYRRFLAGRGWGALALLTAAALGHFYSNYMTAAAFMLALGAVHLVFHRKAWGRREWLGVGAAAAVFLAATVPHAIARQIWVRPDHPLNEPALLRHLKLVWWNFRDIGQMGAIAGPAAPVIGVILLVKYRSSRKTRRVAEWGVLAVAYFFFISLLSPQSTKITGVADIRYLVAALPFLAGLTGILIGGVHRKSRLTAIGLFALLLSTNLAAWTPPGKFKFRWLLPAYLQEIHHAYPTAFGETADYIRQNFKQDDRVLVVPEFANYPLMFYTGDHVRFSCVLEDNSPLAPRISADMSAMVRLDANYPEWLISFGMTENTAAALEYYHRAHREGGRVVQYTYKLYKTLEVFYGATNRPELFLHSFGPKTQYDRRCEAVYIFKRTEES